MLKRRVSTIITCPGCLEKFDFEAHSPVIGACGHSICSVCTNEKNIISCPVCHYPQGFIWKQKNELATELLAIVTEHGVEKLKLQAFQEPDNPFAALFDPENKDLLTAVVNKFEPKDFVNLAMTSRKMKNFCLDNKEIKIFSDELCVMVDFRYDVPRFGVSNVWDMTSEDFLNDDDLFPQDYTGSGGGFFHYRENRQKLQEAPFIYKLDTLKIYGTFTIGALNAISSFLSDFPVQGIDKIKTKNIIHWHGFKQIVMDFKPRIVDISALDACDTSIRSIPNETASYILENTENFTCDLHINDRVILNAPDKIILDLAGTSFWKENFESLVLKCSRSTDDINWTVGCRTFQFDNYRLFRKVLPFNHNGELPEKRPLAFVRENEHYHFFILRKDNKVIHCMKVFKGPAYLKMLEPSEYPPCLQPKT